MKNSKKCQKTICKRKTAFFTLNSPPTRNMYQTLRYGEYTGDRKLSVEQTLKLFHEVLKFMSFNIRK